MKFLVKYIIQIIVIASGEPSSYLTKSTIMRLVQVPCTSTVELEVHCNTCLQPFVSQLDWCKDTGWSMDARFGLCTDKKLLVCTSLPRLALRFGEHGGGQTRDIPGKGEDEWSNECTSPWKTVVPGSLAGSYPPLPNNLAFLWATWICTTNYSGIDLSSPIGATDIQHGVRIINSLLHSSQSQLHSAGLPVPALPKRKYYYLSRGFFLLPRLEVHKRYLHSPNSLTTIYLLENSEFFHSLDVVVQPMKEAKVKHFEVFEVSHTIMYFCDMIECI